eukprot:650561-Rhodomonas_salina.5
MESCEGKATAVGTEPRHSEAMCRKTRHPMNCRHGIAASDGCVDTSRAEHAARSRKSIHAILQTDQRARPDAEAGSDQIFLALVRVGGEEIDEELRFVRVEHLHGSVSGSDISHHMPSARGWIAPRHSSLHINPQPTHGEADLGRGLVDEGVAHQEELLANLLLSLVHVVILFLLLLRELLLARHLAALARLLVPLHDHGRVHDVQQPDGKHLRSSEWRSSTSNATSKCAHDLMQNPLGDETC